MRYAGPRPCPTPSPSHISRSTTQSVWFSKLAWVAGDLDHGTAVSSVTVLSSVDEHADERVQRYFRRCAKQRDKPCRLGQQPKSHHLRTRLFDDVSCRTPRHGACKAQFNQSFQRQYESVGVVEAGAIDKHAHPLLKRIAPSLVAANEVVWVCLCVLDDRAGAGD